MMCIMNVEPQFQNFISTSLSLICHLSLLQYVQSSFFLSFSFSLVYLLISLVNCLSHYIILFSSLSFFSYFQILLFMSLLTRHLFSCLPLYCSNILFSVYLCLPFLSTSFALSCHLPSWGFISIFLLFLSISPFSIGCKEHAL